MTEVRLHILTVGDLGAIAVDGSLSHYGIGKKVLIVLVVYTCLFLEARNGI